MRPEPIEPLRLPRRMAATDALFWFAEEALPAFRSTIGGLYLLDRPPDPARFGAAHDAAVALVPRLRQRVVGAPFDLGLPEWVEDPHFDRGYHLRHLSLPAPGGERELLDVVGAIFATPLDRERSLWEAYWIDGLEGGRTAYFFKMHHSLVDGVGSIAILRALTQAGPDDPPVRVARRVVPLRPPGDGVGERLARLVADNVRESVRLARRAAAAPVRLVANPRASGEALRRGWRGLRGVAADLARPVVRDPLTEGSSGLSRRLDVMAMPFERLRKIKAPLGVTVNDVVLTALAGALGAYHRERGVSVETLHCMVPMNLRGRDERDDMGNRVGTFNIALPVAEPSPVLRLARITRQTRAAKSDQRGAAMPLLLEGLRFVPTPVLGWIARQNIGKVNVACTNIPGVPEVRYMAGATVEAVHPFASVVEGTPVVVALLSYAGRIDIGIDTDPEAIPDPGRIRDLLWAAIEELEERAGVRAATG